MVKKSITKREKQLQIENDELRSRLTEAEETLSAIRNGETDAIVVSSASGDKIFSLTSAETPYRIFIEEMNEGATILSADGTILYSNRRFAELVSIPLEQIVGSNFIQFVTKTETQKFNLIMQTGLKGKSSGEITFLIPDSNPKHFHLSVSSLPPEMSGDVCIMVADITELKQKEEELRRSHDTLEQRVTERTAELTDSIEKLAASRGEVLKMMEDAVQAKKILEVVNNDLKISEERYRTLTNISPVGIFRTDAAGLTTYINPKWSEISGLSYEEALGNNWLKAVHPEDQEKLKQNWQNSTNNKSNSIAEYRFLHSDGTTSWVMGQAVSEMNSENEIIGYVGTITDITERIEAENARELAENELLITAERLNHAMEATSDGLWEDNLITGEAYWSPRYYTLLGYEPNEFLPNYETFKKLIHPDDIDIIEKALNLKGNNEKTNQEIIFRMRSKSHEWRWIFDRFKIIKVTDEGFPEKIVGTITDITNTKLYEENLKRKNRALKVLSACNYIIITDKEEKGLIQNICDKIQTVGDYALVWVGFAMNDERKSVLPIAWAGNEDDYLIKANITWNDTERGRGPVGKAIRTGKPSVIRDVRSDQNFIPWLGGAIQRGYQSIIALPLIENNHVFGTLNIYSTELNAFDKNELELLSELANDLSFGIISIRTKEEHDKLEQQFLQSQKMEAIGKLAGGIAHDFNNILTVIMGNTDIILSGELNAENIKRSGEKIKNSTKKAASLTHQLLAFSRKQMIQPKILDLNLIVTEVQKMLHRLIGEDIDLLLNMQSDLKKIQADPGQIDQIIMNLIVNAKDAMPEGGNLEIKTENITIGEEDVYNHPEGSIGDYVVLEVSDTGTGISDDVKSKIFEPFFTTKEVGKGTGLGLSVVFGIIKQNNGWIELETEVGKGTKFKVFFPSLDAKIDNIDVSNDQIIKYIGQGEKIFIVEDDPDIRNLVFSTLSKNGYTIQQAKNIKEALKIFNDNNGKFDLVFLDIVLPDGSGIELYEKLLSINPNLKALFTSGYADEKAKWSIIQDKKYDFIQKPYETIDLLKAIRNKITANKVTVQH